MYHKRINYIKCTECDVPMVGIHCESVRELCKGCGGESKIQYERDGQRRKVSTRLAVGAAGRSHTGILCNRWDED